MQLIRIRPCASSLQLLPTVSSPFFSVKTDNEVSQLFPLSSRNRRIRSNWQVTINLLPYLPIAQEFRCHSGCQKRVKTRKVFSSIDLGSHESRLRCRFFHQYLSVSLISPSVKWTRSPSHLLSSLIHSHYWPHLPISLSSSLHPFRFSLFAIR